MLMMFIVEMEVVSRALPWELLYADNDFVLMAETEDESAEATDLKIDIERWSDSQRQQNRSCISGEGATRLLYGMLNTNVYFAPNTHFVNCIAHHHLFCYNKC